MGRQITVDLVPLMRAGCKIRVLYNGPEQSWLVDGRVINSDAKGCLSFDCRHMDTSANGWMECWLLYNNVLYAKG